MTIEEIRRVPNTEAWKGIAIALAYTGAHGWDCGVRLGTECTCGWQSIFNAFVSLVDRDEAVQRVEAESQAAINAAIAALQGLVNEAAS